VRLGNCSTADVERLLRHHVHVIQVFDKDPEAAFLSLSW
jgi:predicted nuclease of predicted toxin-antitoxin system